MNFNDKGFMRHAIEAAYKALEEGEVPVGCVIVRDSTVVASGWNKTNASKNATRHAELDAIDNVLFGDTNINTDFVPPLLHSVSVFHECDLYVTLEPCIMCSDAIRRLGFRSVTFGAWNDKFGGVGSVLNLLTDSETTFVGGVFKDEVIKMLQDFYVKGNRNCPEDKRKRVLIEA
ncbi:hypothetical protein GEMRC1_003080 [Eukaryota sp. GEM-RC1]